MNIQLIAHTQLSEEFLQGLSINLPNQTDGQTVALSAIRTCYSPNKPSEIVSLEGDKYFGQAAKDGEGGTDADRLIRQIINSKHLSTVEHISFTFAVEGVSRSLLAQLTRHRIGFSFSVQSQRYVRFGSNDKSEGFDYVTPPSVLNNNMKAADGEFTAKEYFDEIMSDLQHVYDRLRSLGVPAEDARFILPNAATTNFVMTGNLRALLDFYSKRAANGAQWEIRDLAEWIKDEVVKVEPWTKSFFKVV
ncbi:FAD-dependent thymidylate synthase [Metabacillus fastidiosus]|uniref:Flavin-dependent thymidylate synthase n=1 Tax=Metabacillus fastidiosus TaxID=1458 RepID=A0ABU6NRW4_9BACI|nr:FAD-dependent thymidylate synthase [Metabacillus fastidiosus]MED4399824.1 FAD-dependent thymidylate synthase [Metabacillus fastidiosus]